MALRASLNQNPLFACFGGLGDWTRLLEWMEEEATICGVLPIVCCIKRFCRIAEAAAADVENVDPIWAHLPPPILSTVGPAHF